MIPLRHIGLWLLLSCLVTCPALAQTPDSASVLRVLQPLLDSLPKRNVIVGSSTLTRVDSVSRKVLDTLRVGRRAQAAMRLIVPKTATYRSLMFPGLGQIYNHDYWKLPFVYGGFVVLGYYISTFTQSLNTFTAGYTEAYYSPTKTAIVGDRVYGLEQIKSITDKYRSWRDGDIILAVGLYALTAVEANVAAHLKTFDLSESLTMSIKPAVLPVGGLVPAPGVRIALTFK